MNKYMWFLMVTLFLVLITLTADSISMSTTSDIVSTVDVPGNPGILTTIWDFLGTFFRILTFQLDGFPIALNLLIFWPLTLANLFLIVSIIRGGS